MCSSSYEKNIPTPPKKYSFDGIEDYLTIPEEESNRFLNWCKDIWGVLLHTEIDIKDLPLDQRTRIINIKKREG